MPTPWKYHLLPVAGMSMKSPSFVPDDPDPAPDRVAAPDHVLDFHLQVENAPRNIVKNWMAPSFVRRAGGLFVLDHVFGERLAERTEIPGVDVVVRLPHNLFVANETFLVLGLSCTIIRNALAPSTSQPPELPVRRA